jgi:rhomboid family GlyGly-CTERM serine protease
MTNYRSSTLILPLGLISTLILLLSFLGPQQFQHLTTHPDTLTNYEYWRWMTCNFVHYGWAHSLMNLTGFLIIALTLFYFFPVKKFLLMLLFCCLIVGVGISIVDPRMQYAGFSGSLHGLLIAGCFYAKEFPLWKRVLVFLLVIGKIIDEQLPGYDINQLHNLMPVPVAVNSHLLGVLAGLCFVFLDKILQQLILLRSPQK